MLIDETLARLRTITIKQSAPILQAPVFTARQVGKLNKGCKVVVDQELNGYYSLAGSWGWIHNKYIK